MVRGAYERSVAEKKVHFALTGVDSHVIMILN
jgi:hypothetical protein